MPSSIHLSKLREEFTNEGVVAPFRIFTEKEASRYREEFEQIEKVFDRPLPYLRDIHLHLQWAYDLCTHPPLLNLVSELTGGEICVMGAQILTKYPKTDHYVPWHQDAMKNEWNESVTAWLALSESSEKNGCMRVIPGSHANAKQEHSFTENENNMIGAYNLQLANEVDETKALDLVLKPGELSVHHQNIYHCSYANHSEIKRIGLAIRYINPKLPKNREVIYSPGSKRYPLVKHIERPRPFRHKNNETAYRKFLENRLF